MNNVNVSYYDTIYPYYTYPQNGYNSTVQGLGDCRCKKSFLRVLNTQPSELDFQINEIIMAENLSNGEFTRHVQFAPGTYQVKIYEPGKTKKLIFESTIDIERNLAYTGIIVKDDEEHTDISLLMIPEAKDNAISGKMASLRFANLIVDSPDLEMVSSDGTILFGGINYGDVSTMVPMPSGRYTLIIREKSDKKAVKTLKIDLAPRMQYNIFAAGSYDGDNDIKIIIPENGVNYLELC